MSDIATCSVPACPLCGHAGKQLYGEVGDRMRPDAMHWRVQRCESPACASLWLNPRAADSDLARLYENYYTHAAAASRPYPWLFRKLAGLLYRLGGVWRSRAALQAMYLGDRAPGRLLEVGCGAGTRLDHFQALGWQVMGQEVDPVSAQACRERGHVVHLGEVQSLEDAQGFDAIIANHVIEHVAHPGELLSALLARLRPGGRLVLVTPNAQGAMHRLFGVHWRDLDPPRHLIIYTENSLRQLVERSGFAAVSAFSTTANVEVIAQGSFMIRRTGLLDLSWRPGALLWLGLAVLQFLVTVAGRLALCQGDEVVVVAEKP